MSVVRLIKSVVDKLPDAADGKGVYYYDSELKGFALRVSGKTKTYFVQGYIGSKKVRVTLGRHGVLTAEEARKRAQKTLGEIAGGSDPNARKRRDRGISVTLSDLFEEYKQARTADGGLRPKTIHIYESALRRCFGDWLEKPASAITKDMVVERYRELATTIGPRSNETGARSQARQAMGVLRALLNYGATAYEDEDGKPLLPDDAFKRLAQQHRGWNKSAVRIDDIIQPEELKPWYQAVMKLPTPVMRDFLLFCLFTGLRRTAAANLKWSNINARTKVITVPSNIDKTGKGQKLPISDYVAEVLARRSATRVIGNDYIFPGEKPGQPLQEPKRAVEQVVHKSGVKFSSHTLRKTFATTAERLDISNTKVKILLNHTLAGDVTAQHYVHVDIEQLREPMQLIANYLKTKTGIDAENTLASKKHKQPRN
jgi:integrase